MNAKMTMVLIAAASLWGCNREESDAQVFDSERPAYCVVSEDLSRVKADFNAMDDKVRLVFLIGPSCGICLRGMDDLNESIVISLQDDPRVHTFAIHLPALGAKEKHVSAAVPLLSGPRITHYWDESGQSGIDYQQTLDIPFYAWDMWFIYEPGARWEEGVPPPMPDYWEHQLPSLPSETKLDSDRFASEVHERLLGIPRASEETRMAEFKLRNNEIIPVAQPRGVMIGQNHKSRGGYQAIKNISSVRYEGTTTVGGQKIPLTLHTRRPFDYRRTVGGGESLSIVSWNGSSIDRTGQQIDLPVTYQNEILMSYEFDGWMTDWKDKGHQVLRLGMRKIGDRLPWLMEAELTNGRTWHIYVDSHSGDTIKTALIDADDNETIGVEYSDFRESGGFRLPHQITYLDGEDVLAIDRFENSEVTLSAFGDAGPEE